MKTVSATTSNSFLATVIAAAMVAGAGLYFFLPFEPEVKSFGILSVFFILLAVAIAKLKDKYFPLFLFTSLAFSMCTYTAYRVQGMDSHLLPEDASLRAWVSGQIIKMEEGSRTRLTLDHVKIYEQKEAFDSPETIRVSVPNSKVENIFTGDWISMQAMLNGPSSPQFSGDFDFRRYAYLHKLGAVGYLRGEFYQTSAPPEFGDTFTASFKRKFQRWREGVTESIAQVYPNQNGAIAIGLLTGLKHQMSEETLEAFRKSGLAHLLAISGMHIGLITMFSFVVIRRSLAHIPRLALRYDLKKMSAVGALGVSFVYMMLAGASIPTIRAFLLVALMVVAVLLERFRVSLRLLAIVVMIVLLLWPENVVSVSFQMSFSAALALVLYVERQRTLKDFSSRVKLVQTMDYVKLTFLTSLVAGLATLPFAIYHFGQGSVAGFLLNLMAIPLTAFIILPLALLSFIFLPLGEWNLFLWFYQEGCGLLLNLAEWGSHWQWAQVMNWGEWLNSSVTFLWFPDGMILAQQANGAWFNPLPSQDLNSYLIERLADGNLVESSLSYACDASGCVYDVYGKSVAVYAENFSPTTEDCLLADVHLGVICEGEIPQTVRTVEITPQNITQSDFIAQKLRIWEK